MGELEKLGAQYRVALRFERLMSTVLTPRSIAKDPRFERLPCDHKGTYAPLRAICRLMAE